MILAQFDQVAKSHIDSLVDNGVREGRTIEYKRQLPSGRDEDKKEFLADVSSFANASGGDLLYGIEESRDGNGKPTGVPHSAIGLAGINPDLEVQRLENMLRDAIEPRIPGVQIKAIDGFPSGPVILVRAPRSWASPHMVSFKASPRFFSRTSAGKAPLDMAEIRTAFLQSEAIPEKIRRFREDRLGKILAAETPVPMLEGACVVLHLVPISAFSGSQQVDIVLLSRRKTDVPPMNSSGWNGRLNPDGYATFSGARGPADACLGYTQVFRNGAIEAADMELFSGHDDQKMYIPSVAFEREIINGLQHYPKAYSMLGVAPPIVVMLSFLGMKGYFMYVNEGHMRRVRDPLRIDRDLLMIPEILVEDVDGGAPAILRPLFDMVWQACGIERSFNYNEQGRWGAG
jgi:hypothetical protein